MSVTVRIEGSRFEDLLATDELFVEYFNAYLSLPTFPEPLSFNKETGGFEVLSREKASLANEIKAAVRSGRRRKKIYRAVHNHAFSSIPLIPMEEPPMETEKEIDTTFLVQTLNKEQGIQWIKLERLPTFLQSDLYIEYRLAKLLSQAQATDQPEEFVSLRIDYTPKPKKEKKVEVEEEVVVDPTEAMMKDMYVCMGNAATTDTEAWVSQAKMAIDTTTTSSSKTPRPYSSTSSKTRPDSGFSQTSSSGFQSPSKSNFNTAYTASFVSTSDIDDLILEEDTSDAAYFFGKTKTPRPSDTVVVLADVPDHRPKSVYSLPIVENDDKVSEEFDQVSIVDDDDNVSKSSIEEDKDSSTKEVTDAESLVEPSKEEQADEKTQNEDVEEVKVVADEVDDKDKLETVAEEIVDRKIDEEQKEDDIEDVEQKASDEQGISEEVTDQKEEDIKEEVSEAQTDDAKKDVERTEPKQKDDDENGKDDTATTEGENEQQSEETMATEETGESDAEEVAEESTGALDEEASDENKTMVAFKNVGEMGSVIVGTVLTQAVVDVTGSDESEVKENPEVSKMFTSEDHSKLSLDSFRTVECIVTEDEGVPNIIVEGEPTPPPSDDETDDRLPQSTAEQNEQEPKAQSSSAEQQHKVTSASDNSTPDTKHVTIATTVSETPPKEAEPESDEDSLLGSDNDYEGDRDLFFRKKKAKTFNLLHKKGLEKFKDFLKGTTGERIWLLWIDIERAKVIENEEELIGFLTIVREKYHKQGGILELSQETKLKLKLVEPTKWTLDNLTACQNSLLEPLLLYWAPKFLLNQKTRANPDKNPLYHNLQSKIAPMKKEVFPCPPTVTLLPLRPKTCMPSLRASVCTIEDAIELTPREEYTNYPQLPKTSPPVGYRRTYHLPEAFLPPESKKEKDNINSRRKIKTKTPKELLSARLKSNDKPARPPSAPPVLGHSPVPPRQKHVQLVDPLNIGSPMGSRPSSANSLRSRSSSTVSVQSEFTGGRRMEGLLQALANEKPSGAFIRKYVEKAGNKLWKRCLTFWEELQEYHKLFYTEIIDPFLLQKKAKYLYSQYIVTGSPLNIQCAFPIKRQIYHKLHPPFEELFDPAEEYILTVLYDTWAQMMTMDITTFDKVELIEVKRQLEAKSKYVVSLQRRGIIKERPDTPEDLMEGYQDPVYDDTLFDKIPEDYREWTLEKLVHNRIELEKFREFLSANYASMDLMCWMDVEAFKRITHTEEKRRDLKAKEIKTKYLNKKYFFGPNSPAGKEGQTKVMEAGGGWGKLLEDRPPTAIILEAQKYVRDRLEKKWLPLFLATEEFAERQKPQFGMDDAVEDVIIQRKKKSQAIWKMLESKWVSSSKDILTFRKALMNPVSSAQFRRFVSIKGDNFENDVLFWQEVQKYKELCHAHSDRHLIQQKTAAIINCFVDSPIPPALQVDITQEMAEKLCERKLEAAPYLFREAQMTVFRVLFSHWTDFCNFRSNTTDDKMVVTIERHRRRAKVQEKKRLKQEEEKKLKEAARRKALGLPPETADGEADVEDEEKDNFDPFKKGGDAGSDDGASETGEKNSISWSYSHYMKALDEEEDNNMVDESTFSSLSGSITENLPPVAVSGSESGGDKVSQLGDEDSKKTSEKASTETIKKKKSSKTDVSEAGSQTGKAEKPKKTVRIAEKPSPPTPSQPVMVTPTTITEQPKYKGITPLVNRK